MSDGMAERSGAEVVLMRLQDLPGTIGSEVLDADLGSAPIAGSWTVTEIDALRAAYEQRHLLLLRGSVMSGEAQAGFVARFGPLVAEGQLWGFVSNVRPDGIVPEGALLFHSDFAFAAAPVEAISLHALEMPDDGAPTLFADAVRAAAALPSDLRQRLDGRRVLNLYDFHLPDDQPMRVEAADSRAPRFEHPVLWSHPRSGLDVVMANEMHTDHIVGLPRAESNALLADLFAVLYDPANLYEHHWRVGDLLLWDNVALQHGRRDFPKQAVRTLQRVTLGRYTPSELIPDLAALLA